MTLNEKISAWFEPKPTEERYHGLYSPTKAWLYNEDFHVWAARRWDEDEEANAKLLEAMPSPMLLKSKQNSNWVCRPDYGIAEYAPEHKDRKIAIRMAFCKFAGISEDE